MFAPDSGLHSRTNPFSEIIEIIGRGTLDILLTLPEKTAFVYCIVR